MLYLRPDGPPTREEKTEGRAKQHGFFQFCRIFVHKENTESLGEVRSNVTKETARYETDVFSSGSNSKQGRSNDAEHTNVTENYKGHMVDYNHDVVRDTMLIPNNINQWGEENYELTGYINDVNTEYTQVLMEYSKSGMVNNIYEYGIQRESMSWYGRKGYYAYDGRGSVADVTGSASQTMVQYKYNNYGETSSLVNGYNNYVRNPYRYNAERTDEVAGVPDQQYLRARYYNANMGRFLTSDTYLGNTYDPLSLSLYAYCGNNPVNFVDPSGHRPLSSDGDYSSLKKPSPPKPKSSANQQAAVKQAVTNVQTVLPKPSPKPQVQKPNAIKKPNTTESIKKPQTESQKIRQEAAVSAINTLPGVEAPVGQGSSYLDTQIDKAKGNNFVQSKCIPHKLPEKGDPNSSEYQYNENGDIIRERQYGSDGRVKKDIDFDDHSNPKQHPNVPHVHDWDWSVKGDPRQPERPFDPTRDFPRAPGWEGVPSPNPVNPNTIQPSPYFSPQTIPSPKPAPSPNIAPAPTPSPGSGLGSPNSKVEYAW